MVVRKKQSVASGVKNDVNVDPIEFDKDTVKKPSKKSSKKPAKKAQNHNKKKNTKRSNVNNLKSAMKSGNSEFDEGSDIIKAHLDALGKDPLAKDMRTEKIAFCVFLALPEDLRGTQGEFSKKWNIHENTLTAWKQDRSVQRLRMKLMKAILIDKTPAVLDNLFYAASQRGFYGGANTQAIKLWLQYVEEWSEATKIDLQASGGFIVNFGVGKSQFIDPDDEKENPNDL